jgi:hypothetical protein
MVAAGIRLLVIVSTAVLIGACGGGGGGRSTSTRTRTTPPHNAPLSQVAANPAAVRVIRAWSDALRRGDVRRAAGYFAVPSEMVNGVGPSGQPVILQIGSAAEAQLANETLPCGARFVSAYMHGPYVDALFVLTGRPGPGGSDCGTGRGATARTNFVISGGRIVEWIRAPDEPGDSAHGTAPPSGPVA